MTDTVIRWLVRLALVAAVLAGGLAYRASLIDDGFKAGVASEKALAAQATEVARKRDEKLAIESEAKHASAMQSLKDTHDRITNGLRQALADSDLRNVRLSSELARLHDAAAAGDGTAAAAGAPQGAPGSPAPDWSVADLITTANENYAICHRNAARLVELQTWYETLRATRTSQ